VTQLLAHGNVKLALHPLREAPGRALLLLHGLGESSPRTLEPPLASWPGPVFALDFTGHGASTLPVGGGYSAEILVADADIALAHLGEASVLGRGLGAYVALLLSGARPASVRGAILCDGPGLTGGGSEPGPPRTPEHFEATGVAPDPYAQAELSTDVRPPEYALHFAAIARRASGLEHPLQVCAQERPPWLAALLSEGAAVEASLPEALARCASAPDSPGAPEAPAGRS
jgi:pimeloyl-ACP methyl ester carboxylesterase